MTSRVSANRSRDEFKKPNLTEAIPVIPIVAIEKNISQNWTNWNLWESHVRCIVSGLSDPNFKFCNKISESSKGRGKIEIIRWIHFVIQCFFFSLLCIKCIKNKLSTICHAKDGTMGFSKPWPIITTSIVIMRIILLLISVIIGAAANTSIFRKTRTHIHSRN